MKEQQTWWIVGVITRGRVLSVRKSNGRANGSLVANGTERGALERAMMPRENICYDLVSIKLRSILSLNALNI